MSSTPQSLPALLEELRNKLSAVDTLTETICVVVVQQVIAPAPDRPRVPVFTLAKLCGLLELVRESVTELEFYCE